MKQQEHIKVASKAYIIYLNDPKDAVSTARFQIYLLTNNNLNVIWPEDCNLGKASADLLPYQIYTTIKKYPAYHFVLKGCGYSKIDELRQMLRDINSDIMVSTITGLSPSQY